MQSAAMRANNVHRRLDLMQREGVIRSYYCQSGMPGRVWVVEIGNGHAERSFTTNEAEAFILGWSASVRADIFENTTAGH